MNGEAQKRRPGAGRLRRVTGSQEKLHHRRTPFGHHSPFSQPLSYCCLRKMYNKNCSKNYRWTISCRGYSRWLHGKGKMGENWREGPGGWMEIAQSPGEWTWPPQVCTPLCWGTPELSLHTPLAESPPGSPIEGSYSHLPNLSLEDNSYSTQTLTRFHLPTKPSSLTLK